MAPQPTRLADWRRANGLTLAEVADLVGISTPMVSRLERGERRASPQLKVAMARRLGATVSDLFEPEPIDAPEVAAR
jgi:transcriptional regulator with XRE-family HTH domain